MRWSAALLVLGAGLANAAAEGESAVEEPQYRFGELSAWQDRAGIGRIPIDQRPMFEPGNRGLAPPRSRRQGFEPRLGTTLEYNNNVLLAQQDRSPGHALILLPGFNWLDEGPRHRFDVDASVEAIKGLTNGYDPKALDAATLRLGGGFRPGPTSTVQYAGTLLYSHDPAGSALNAATPVPVANQRFASVYQRHEAGFGQRLGPTTEVSARWTGILAHSENPAYLRTASRDLEAGMAWRLSATQGIAATLRDRRADFAGRAAQDYRSAWLEYQHQWSRTLRGKVALAAVSGLDHGPRALWRGELAGTFGYGQWGATVERDVLAIGGLGEFYSAVNASVAAGWRVGDRARLDVALQVARYQPVAGGVEPVRITRPRVSWSVPMDSQWWFNLRYLGVDDQIAGGNLRRRGDRVMASIVRSF